MIIKFENFKNTKLISAFPGCGKSHFFNNTDLNVLDSDSSTFDKEDFPENYITHIKENMGEVDIILISSHDVVREALNKNDLEYTLVYPDIKLKGEYLKRYSDRGNDDGFVKLLTDNWDIWLSQLDDEDCDKVILQEDEYLSDILTDNTEKNNIRE